MHDDVTAPAGEPQPPLLRRGVSEATRERIVEAARVEFAAHGIAGARVDRIAKAARTSKERVYAYWRSKEELYAFVATQELSQAGGAVQLDPRDLPAYALAMFDYYEAHPDQLRFVSWGRLELRAADGPGAADVYGAAIVGKVDRLRQAQLDGHLDPSWDPMDVFALVNHLALTWAASPELAAAAQQVASDPSPGARRAAVARAVTQLFPPSRL